MYGLKPVPFRPKPVLFRLKPVLFRFAGLETGATTGLEAGAPSELCTPFFYKFPK